MDQNLTDFDLHMTRIVNDLRKAFSRPKGESYVHLVVFNHSFNYVDLNTGAHTQNIESTWSTGYLLYRKFIMRVTSQNGYAI